MRTSYRVSARQVEASGLVKEHSPVCEVRQNLFGQWVVLRRWGRVSAKQGQCIEEVCNLYEEIEIFDAVGKRQAKRDYIAVLNRVRYSSNGKRTSAGYL